MKANLFQVDVANNAATQPSHAKTYLARNALDAGHCEVRRLASFLQVALAVVQIEFQELRHQNEVLAVIEEVVEAKDARLIVWVRGVDILQQLYLIQGLL